MKSNSRRDFLKLAGAAVVSVTGVASAAENAFGFKQLDSGYSQVSLQGTYGGAMPKLDDSEGRCGVKKPEGTCGAKEPEGACGGKQPEARCGGLKS